MKKTLCIVLSIVLLISALFILTGCGDSKKSSKENVKISKTEASQITYEDYDNDLISLKIPTGWKVEVAPNDYIHYAFKVYNPENENYMFLFSLKMEGFMKTEKARSTWAKLYPTSAFSKITPIDPQTTEGFYASYNANAKYSNESSNSTFLPYLNNFEVIENLGKISLGGDILRASFTNNDGERMQGLFTATVYDPGTYYMYGVDLMPLSVYNTIMMMAPDDEFINWQSILDYCIGTIEFSQKFLNAFNSEELSIVQTVQANQKVYDEISDMIMDSWEKRSSSYDIISQKRSDATLGYERVYNTETGEVYRAYNGFTDSYNGTKYQSITDDMYTSAISGYIEK